MKYEISEREFIVAIAEMARCHRSFANWKNARGTYLLAQSMGFVKDVVALNGWGGSGSPIAMQDA